VARVTCELPSVLDGIVGGRRQVEVEASTLAGALDALVAELPALRTHLYDERGAFRQHVLCFHNERNTRWLDDLEVAVADGDVIRFLQAVSGG